jgi:hypothetical protein
MLPFALLLAIQLLEPGSFHGNEVRAVSGQTWLALVWDEKGSALQPVTIHVAKPDPSDQSSYPDGKRVTVKPAFDDSLVALLRGPELHEGPVTTAVFPDTGELEIGKTVPLTLPDSPARYTLTLSCKPAKTVYSSFRCPLVLSDGSQSQEIFVYRAFPGGLTHPSFTGTAPYLAWAGDLDGDGKLDLLVNTTNSENSRDLTLYLSSKAKNGALAGVAAQFLTVGC